MKKRIAVIGKGTSGSQSVIHFLRNMPDYEIQWYFDSTIPTQSVGEGSTVTLPSNLCDNLDFNYSDLDKIDSTLKVGIYKSGWGRNGTKFLHSFAPSVVGMHFNARSLQNFIYGKVKNKVTIIDKNVGPEEVDADYVIDCSGKPDSYESFYYSQYIPVNSAYITHCYWDYARFQHTLTIARPYGWVFGIPLQNRCSIGYLFNKEINNLDDIREDISEIFKEYNLVPSDNTNYLEFKNYYRKRNYSNRVVYNGNSSFFLEPLEATSIDMMNFIQRSAVDLWNNNLSPEQLNCDYLRNIKQIETVIMMHYFSGSVYDTNFWRFAKNRGEKAVENALKNDSYFSMLIKHALEIKQSNLSQINTGYGTWSVKSFHQNLRGLGLENIMSYAKK
jgi:hypothetical protein